MLKPAQNFLERNRGISILTKIEKSKSLVLLILESNAKASVFLVYTKVLILVVGWSL